jgi:hypothetical protein
VIGEDAEGSASQKVHRLSLVFGLCFNAVILAWRMSAPDRRDRPIPKDVISLGEG